MKPEKIQRVLDLAFEIERLEREEVMYGNGLKELKEHLSKRDVFELAGGVFVDTSKLLGILPSTDERESRILVLKKELENL